MRNMTETTHRTVIESIGVYLPLKVVSTKEVLQGCRRPVHFPMEQFTGIHTRRVAGDEEYSIDLAKKATAACLAQSGREVSDIGLLICCNISRFDGPRLFSYEPCTSIKLRHHFGIPNAISFDITNGCAGMFTAIGIVDAFLQVGAIDCGLVVSGEYITHLTQTAQLEIKSFMDPRMACLTLGDAGAALTLERSRDGVSGFHALDLYTLGRYSSYCVALATDREHGGAIMLTDSLRLHAVTIQEAISHAVDILERVGARPDAFEHLIMHQTSRKTLSDAAEDINRRYRRRVCHPGNVIYNLAERGNTATTSHIVALHDNITNGRVRSGDNVIFGITGSGLTVGTAIYTLDDLPDRLRNGHPRPSSLLADDDQSGWAPHMHERRVRIESVGRLPAGQEALRRNVEMVRIAAEIENNADILPDRLVGVRETASAVVLDVAPREQTGFGRFLFRSFTEHLDRYVVEARHQAGRPYLELRRSPDLDDRYASCLAKVAEELLARDGIKRSEVDIVLPPQRSSVFVQRLSRAINLPLERCVDVSTDGLDLYTSSLPYAFQRVSEQGLARQGDIGLVLDVGAGIQVGAAIYRF